MRLPSKEAIYNAITPANLIGRGGNANVYSLNDYPDFVVRVSHHFSAEKSPLFSEPSIIDNSEYQGKNFGQAHAQYGAGVSLLHRQRGIACGVPPYLRKNKASQAANDSMLEEHTAVAAAMPRDAYVNLLRDMQFVDSIHKRIDPSKANNLLIHSEGEARRFNLVDLNPADPSTPYKNFPGELIVMLFDNSYGWKYQGSNHGQLVEGRRQILEKMMSAAEELQIPFCRGKVSEDSSLSYSLTLAGYPEDSPERSAIEARIESTAVGQRADGQPWTKGMPPKGSGFTARFRSS